jgi:hypothetical protein
MLSRKDLIANFLQSKEKPELIDPTRPNHDALLRRGEIDYPRVAMIQRPPLKIAKNHLSLPYPLKSNSFHAIIRFYLKDSGKTLLVWQRLRSIKNL